MERYEEYKDSGAEWLGEIPFNWNSAQIGSLYSLRNTKVSDRDYPPLSVTMKGVVPQLETAAKTDDHDSRKLVKKGDFAINSRSDRRGSCGISDYDGSVSLINTVLTPRGNMNPKYYDWLFHTIQFADEFYKNGHGIVDDLWTTRWDEMKRIIIPVPSDVEQREITGYLIKQVGAIDEIIVEAKASIEDYKSWKASIIYEAVTKGLDKNVEMKDSGIPWIGIIPACWKVTKLKFFSSIRTGITLGQKYPNGTKLVEYPYLRVANVKSSYLDLSDIATIQVTEEEAKKYCLQNGEMLMTEGGDRDKLGRGTVWHAEIDPCLHQNHIFAVKTDERLLAQYVSYLTASSVGRDYFDMTASQSVHLASTNSTKIMNFVIPYPEPEEQSEIVNYLDKKCRQIDSLISEKQSLISDLESYKKSLIFETITGKRKVV